MQLAATNCGLRRRTRTLTRTSTAHRACRSIRSLDRPCKIDARANAHLVEHVVHVTLDRLLAEEQLGGDLWVRSTSDDEARDLKLTFSEQLDADSVTLPGPRTPVDVLSELS